MNLTQRGLSIEDSMENKVKFFLIGVFIADGYRRARTIEVDIVGAIRTNDGIGDMTNSSRHRRVVLGNILTTDDVFAGRFQVCGDAGDVSVVLKNSLL